jgi:hypothetical protein
VSQSPEEDCSYNIWSGEGVDLSVTVREVARQITAVENGVSPDQATGEPYHNVYTSLIQSHLPRLDAVRAIEYDSDRKIMRPDQNLLPLFIAASTTSPIQILFHSTDADLYAGGMSSQDVI